VDIRNFLKEATRRGFSPTSGLIYDQVTVSLNDTGGRFRGRAEGEVPGRTHSLMERGSEIFFLVVCLRGGGKIITKGKREKN